MPGGKMSVRAEVDGEAKAVELPRNSTIEDLIIKLGQSPETTVASVGGKVTLHSEKVPSKGKVSLYRVVSGG